MILTFTPKTEEQIAESGLWPAGQYAFEILDQVTLGAKQFETTNTLSKSGNPMIRLVTKVYNEDGNFRIVIDHLVAAMEFKVRHAAAACGILDKYNTGQLSAEDFVGKQGYLELGIGKPREGYGVKNEVKDYCKPGENGSEIAEPTLPDDDDINF